MSTQRSTKVGVAVTGFLLAATLVCGSLIGQATLASSLEPRVSAALTQAGLPGDSVSFTGREATVTVEDQAERDRAKSVVESVYGVRWATVEGDSQPSPSPSPTDQPPTPTSPPASPTSPPTSPSQPTSPTTGQPSTPSSSPTAAPAPFGVTVDSSAGQLSASGTVADKSAAADLLTQVGRVFGGSVADNLTADPSTAEPSWWGDLPAVVAKFPSIDGGSLTVTDAGIVVKGTVADNAALQQLKDAAQGAGFPIDVQQVTARQPSSTLSAAETAKLNKTVVLFRTGSYSLDNTAKASLKAIVPLLKKSTVGLEIRGYVSKPHPAGREVSDSKRRAQAVANYLVAAGINSKRLTVIGRGAADPVSAKNTSLGSRANQRATLTVKEG